MAQKPPDPQFREMLRVLTEHEVDFIVIGGVCGILHGALWNTVDLDVIYSRSPENIDRLMDALTSLDAYFRDLAGRRIRPDRSYLVTTGAKLLTTSLGWLDVLGAIGADREYPELLEHTVEKEVALGVRVKVLDLPTLIASKEEAGRDKDKAVLPILRNALKEQQRLEGGEAASGPDAP